MIAQDPIHWALVIAGPLSQQVGLGLWVQGSDLVATL